MDGYNRLWWSRQEPKVPPLRALQWLCLALVHNHSIASQVPLHVCTTIRLAGEGQLVPKPLYAMVWITHTKFHRCLTRTNSPSSAVFLALVYFPSLPLLRRHHMPIIPGGMPPPPIIPGGMPPLGIPGGGPCCGGVRTPACTSVDSFFCKPSSASISAMT